jgi:competence protein ComFC
MSALLEYNTMNLSFIGDIFYPPKCVGCGHSITRGILCEPCQQGIEVFNSLFCATCGARLPERKKVCHLSAPYILGAAGRYDDDALRGLIHALKFQSIASAAHPLAEMLVKYVIALPLDLHEYIITSLPLSLQRERSRGFNQSSLIARSFAATLNLPFVDDILRRVHHRMPQSDTNDLSERKKNVRGCFSLAHPNAAKNKKIVLVDDVITSGTTFMEAARVLKLGGAKKIIALAVARA